jgi:hypothetical protein
MLGDIVADVLRAQDDMAVVGHLPTLNRIQEITKGHAADVVVVGMTDGVIPGACWGLLTLEPGVKVFVIALKGRRSMLCEFQELGALAPHAIASAIRHAYGLVD